MQDVTFEKLPWKQSRLGGWSKAENVKSIRQYCIPFDVEYDDGTFDWEDKPLGGWNTEWQHALGLLNAKPVKKISSSPLSGTMPKAKHGLTTWSSSGNHQMSM